MSQNYALLVAEDRGRYEPTGRKVAWETVQASAETVTRVETLSGWGEFTACYRVDGSFQYDGYWFVKEE